jgi:Macrocin-O-methyltransferase (TylF)
MVVDPSQFECVNEKSELVFLKKGIIKPDSGNGYICNLPPAIPVGDDDTGPSRSQALLFENGSELGPRHVSHVQIRALGGGRFSHWKNQLYFSTSDNSSPLKNGREYRLLVPAGIYLGTEFESMAPMDRFVLARLVYRRISGDTPLPDHSRRIDNDRVFTREFARLSPENDVTHERKYNLDQLFQLVLQVGGDVAECGTYKGGSAFFLARRIINHRLDKRLCLFDSFEGLSAPASIDGNYWHAGALSSRIEDVQRALAPLGAIPFIDICKGWIPDRFHEVADRRFCFVHIDVDLYQPSLDSIAFFYPRLEPGGIILLDDYGFESCPGVTAAVDRFMADKPEPIINLSAGGALIMKKA